MWMEDSEWEEGKDVKMTPPKVLGPTCKLVAVGYDDKNGIGLDQ